MSALNHNSVNKQAFVDLYSAHARRIYSYTLTLVPNTADADDVFQEVSRVLWEKYDQFEAGTDFYAWSCRIVQFQVMFYRQKLRREHRSRLEFSDEFITAVGQLALDEAESLERQHRVLQQCLEKLTPRVRKLVQLRFAIGATTKSVAAQVGQSVETVYKSINRAQKVLIECGQRLLQREGGS
jgi:RNA polymerase sigma-70 factor (ECF subfamily)